MPGCLTADKMNLFPFWILFSGESFWSQDGFWKVMQAPENLVSLKFRLKVLAR